MSAHLAQLLAGRCVTFDYDLLLDAAESLSGEGTVDWPAYREAWLAVAHGIAQSGLPTVVIGPLIPDHLEGLPGRRVNTALKLTPCHRLKIDPPPGATVTQRRQ